MSQTETPPESVAIRDLLAIRNFRLLWMGQIVSNFGDSLTYLTLVLLINRVTDGSTQAIATLLIALALPAATIGLVAGVVVDRLDRKRIMQITDVLRGVLALAFLFFIQVGSPLWPLYLIAFIHSAIGSFFLPARSALIPNIVPEAGLLAANSLSQTSLVFFRVLGTAVAGFLVGVLDTFWPAFLIDAATFFISFWFISLIQMPEGVTRTTRAGQITIRAVFTELREGMGILVQNRALVGTLVGLAVTMLGIGAVNVLLAPLLVNEMGVGETWFGVIEFAQTAAMIISGSLVALLAARIKGTHIISSGLLLTGAAIGLLSLIKTVWHLIPILFAIGFVMTPLNAAIATLMQTAVADELRGRISSAMGAAIQAANLLSMFAAGAVAAAIGARNVFILSGVITLFAGIIAALIFRGYTPPPPTPVELQPAGKAV